MASESMAGDSETTTRGRPIFLQRILVAVVQAAALYWLTSAAEPPLSWPATESRLFEPLLLVSVYVPLVLLLGLGQIRLRPLAICAAIAAAVIMGLGFHQADRVGISVRGPTEASWPTFRFFVVLSASLFVAHVLVIDSAAMRRLAPPYSRHFDTAWRLGVQAVLAVAFLAL